MNKTIYRELLAPSLMVCTIVMAGALLLSNHTHADDVVSTATVTVPASCTMSGSGMDSHTAEVPNGTIVENIGNTVLKVYCNDNEGFSVYAAGFSDDTLGNTFIRDSSLGSSSDIATGTTFSGTSQWAMKIGATSGTYTPTIAGSTGDEEKQAGDTDYSTWAEIPSVYTRIAYRNSGTDVDNNSIASAEGASITATYKAFVSTTQPAGTYVGKVKFTMLHPASEEPLRPQTATSGCINYFPNGSNVEGTMGCQSISSTDTTKTLLASNFSREGYGFAGWNTAYDYSGTFYGPNEDIIFTAGQYTGDNDGLALYAVWVSSAGSLQDSVKVAELCGAGQNSLTQTTYTEDSEDSSIWSLNAGLSSVSALTDSRDGQTYAIAKLTDGNCWMIENLRLADTHQEGNNTVPTTLTITNTNNPLNDGSQTNPTVTLKHNYADTTTFTNLSPSTNVAYDEATAPEGWCTTNSSTCNDQSRLRTDCTINRATNPTAGVDINLYGYGNYYNWYSATAGNGTNGKTGGTTDGDLCPIGWHLPYGGSSANIKGGNTSGGFYYLAKSLGHTDNSTLVNSKKHRSFPVNFVFSGSIMGAQKYAVGTYTDYWSSAASCSYSWCFAYALEIKTGYYFYPGTRDLSKYQGAPVRCVASPSA